MAGVRFEREPNGPSASSAEGEGPVTADARRGANGRAQSRPSDGLSWGATAAPESGDAQPGSCAVEWRRPESDDPSTSNTDSASADTANGHESGKSNGSGNGSGNGDGNGDGNGLKAGSSSSGVCHTSASGRPSTAEPSSSSSTRLPPASSPALTRHHVVWGGLEAVDPRTPKLSRRDGSENETSSGSSSSTQRLVDPAAHVGLDDLGAMERYVLRKLRDWNVDPAGILFEDMFLSGQESGDLQGAEDRETGDHEEDAEGNDETDSHQEESGDLQGAEDREAGDHEEDAEGNEETDSDQEVRGQASQPRLPSVGSAAHSIGKCTPCLLFASPAGCPHETDCTWCHMPHAKAKKMRSCKGKRDRYKRFVQHLQNAIADADDPEEFDIQSVPILPSILADPAEMAKLLQRIRSMKQSRRQPQEAEDSPPSAARGQGHLAEALFQQRPLSTGQGGNFQDAEDPETDSDEEREQSQRELASVGSAAHHAGRCTPCALVGTLAGCPQGSDCLSCHLPHAKQKQFRKCKGKRDRHKKFFRRLDEAIAASEDPEAIDLNSISIPPSISTDPAEMGKVHRRIQRAATQLGKQGDQAGKSSSPKGATADPVEDQGRQRSFQ